MKGKPLLNALRVAQSCLVLQPTLPLPTISCNVLRFTPTNLTMASLIDLPSMAYASIQTNTLRDLDVVDVV